MHRVDWPTIAIVVIVAILFFIVLALGSRAEATIEADIASLDIYVSDGDTFRVKNPKVLAGTLDIEKHQNDKGQLEIRIQGIDAPEMKQSCYHSNGEKFDCGGYARKELLRILAVGKLYCVKSGRSYNRVVMRCSVDGESIGVHMVEGGFAFFDPNPRYTSGVYRLQLMASEGRAKVNRVGVWSQPEVVKPWEWRKLH